MDVETKPVGVTSVPVDVLEYLAPHAVHAGHKGTDAGIMRFAVIELARLLRVKETAPTTNG